MVTINSEHEKITLNNITVCEEKMNIKFPRDYKEFLIEYNGGNVKPNIFKVSDSQGESAVNMFYGIDVSDQYDDLLSVFDSLDGEIPDDFISIGDDSAGNQICLGVRNIYSEKVYIWIHDMEVDEDMDNMFILADSFNEFIGKLYTE